MMFTQIDRIKNDVPNPPENGLPIELCAEVVGKPEDQESEALFLRQAFVDEYHAPQISEKIWYCITCAKEHQLRIRGTSFTSDDPAAGRCGLCGNESMFVGSLTSKETELRGVRGIKRQNATISKIMHNQS